MRSISTFPKDASRIDGLVRSMNYSDDNNEDATNNFLDEYRETNQRVRQIFNDTLCIV